uniref:Uncharacterized protein n=1 Tax=Sander lucioperca TaxID=283035 RepID=A0A8C9XHN7_SANLU
MEKRRTDSYIIYSLFRLWNCSLSETSCASMASALKSNPSHLRELDLSDNRLQDSDVKLLCELVESPKCRLETLRSVEGWSQSTDSFESKLMFIIVSKWSHLRNISLFSVNFKLLIGLEMDFYLHHFFFRLERCSLSAISCASLASALKSNPSHLKQLDLRYNKLQDSDVKLLCDLVESPNCRLETLRSVEGWSQSRLVSASNPSHLRELNLSDNKMLASEVECLCAGLRSPNCRLETLRLQECWLSEISCASLVSALKSNPSHLRELDLSYNFVHDSGVKLLCGFLESPDCRLETLSLSVTDTLKFPYRTTARE